MLAEQRLGVAAERRMAGQALIEGGGGRVNIACRSRRGAGDLLGRGVRQRARRDRAVTGPRRDAEVGQLAGAFPVDEHVCWLVVPVHDAVPVRGRQAQQRALQHHQRGFRGGGALTGQDLLQGDAVDELHDDGRARRRFGVFIEPNDVRVRHGGQRGRLGPEHHGELWVSRQVTAQVLDRDQRAGGVVPG